MSFKVWNGELIRKVRHDLEMNQKDFAERLGARQQQVSHWEKKNRTPGRAYQRLLTMLYEKLLEEKRVSSETIAREK